MDEKRFLSADEVAAVMECSKSHAYIIIRQLNEELKENNYLISRGKINAKYFYERIYDGAKS